MTPPNTTAFTAAGYLQGLLGQMMVASVSGQETLIAGTLEQIAPPLQSFGREDLSTRLAHASNALKSGDYKRTDWLKSRLYGELSGIHEALKRGDPVEEAVKARQASEALGQLIGPLSSNLPSIVARSPRVTVGPAPRIEWAKFGTAEHPAPNPPSASVTSAGKRLSYLFYYVAAHAGHGETDTATEQFFEISSALRRRLREGRFAPEALGQFPSSEAAKLIAKAAAVEPLYGKLMKELVTQSLFESQGWSLGLPAKDAPWNVFLLYGLRRHVACQLLSPEGRKTVLADRPLIQIVRGDHDRLQDVTWHPGRTRREVFESWLQGMSRNAEHLAAQRRFLGDGFLRSMPRWAAPEEGASADARLQWLVRYWIAHCHYGALPARGLPYPPNTIFRFALAGRPTDVRAEFRADLIAMMRDFFTDEELTALDIRGRTG
jgi:hypothetical protein